MDSIDPHGLFGSINAASLRVNPDQVYLRPGRGRGGLQGGHTVARHPFAADPALLFRLIEAVHDALPLVSPAVLDHAVDEHGVNIVGVVGFTMLVDGLEHLFRLAGNFGLDEELFPRQALDGAAEPIERSIRQGAVKISDALVVGVTDQGVEPFAAQVPLYLSAIAARSHTQT